MAPWPGRRHRFRAGHVIWVGSVLLRKAFSLGADILASKHQANMEMICQLIELYWTHVDVQQTSCVCKETFFNQVKSGNFSAGLCFAMLAVSAKYLNHKAAKSFLGHGQEAVLAHKARERLTTVGNDDLVDHGQAFCILALYEMHRGNGVQAWVDIGEQSDGDSQKVDTLTPL